jgi:ribosome maturation factor RimP
LREEGQHPSFLLAYTLITKSHIEELIAERIENTDMFLVDLRITEGNKITVIMDADSGLSIDQCVAVSRQIEHNLDREQEDFELSVLSPGLSNPLLVKRQYMKNIGRSLRVHLNTDATVEGKLIFADEKEIHLEYETIQQLEGKKKKTKVVEVQKIDYTNIREAKVMISFK